MDRRYCQTEEKSSPLQEVKPLANETTLVKGEKIKDPHAPASFTVMLNYLRGLSLDVELKKKK